MPYESEFKAGFDEPPADTPALWFLFQGYRLVVSHDDEKIQIPLIREPADIGLIPLRQQYLGQVIRDAEMVHCLCGEIDENVELPAGYTIENLRTLYASLDEQSFWLAGRAVQIVDWDRTNQFCGKCGSRTVQQKNERAKICPHCGLTSFPQLAPAVIVRVQKRTPDGPLILLARAKRFPTSMFSVLAGFVEPGETLEECVQREIHEEVGISVNNIAYFGSQPWPFPHSLMIAFTADYKDGELAANPDEIAEAGWYSAENLPAVPGPPSIANRLINTWLAENPQVQSLQTGIEKSWGRTVD